MILSNSIEWMILYLINNYESQSYEGITSLVGAGATYALRGNLVASTIINYGLTPLQLLLGIVSLCALSNVVIPFIRMGEALFSVKVPIDFDFSLLGKDVFGALGLYGGALLRAVVVWLLLSVPLTYSLYHIIKLIIRPFVKSR